MERSVATNEKVGSPNLSGRAGSLAGRLGRGRFRAEGPRRVTLRPLGPGELALARQLLDPLFFVVRARQRREERNEVVDIPFRQGERLDVLVEIGILQAVSLVVVVHDIPQSFLRAD